jgi:putative drug exporter of the RND superfamily
VRSLTALALRRPRTLLAAWGLVILVLSAIGLGAQSRLGTGSIEAPGTESARATGLDESSFGSNESLLVLLKGSPRDLDREGPGVVRALRRHWSAVSPWDSGRDVARLRPRPTRALVLVGLTAPSENKLYDRLTTVKAILHRTVHPPVAARISGFTVVGAALRDETLSSAALAEKISIPILVIVLLLVFRAPLAATVPAIVGLATVSASAGVISLLAHKLDLTALAVSSAAMMGLALGVDYSLLIVSRFREEIDDADGGPARAARIASATAGRTVLFAGMVLLITMLVAVLLSPGDLLVSVTVGVTTAVVLSMVSGAIVVPALLLLIGSRIDALRIGPPLRRSTLLPALARFATRYAPLVLAASLLVLLVPGLLARDLHTSALNVRVLPPDNQARRDVEEIAGLVGYGYVTPFEIALHARRAPITEPRTLDAIERFQQRLVNDPAVAGVVGPGALATRTGSVIELPKRIPKLRRQAVRASNGVRQLRSGLLAASEGAGRLRDGARQAQSGVARLQNGAQQLDTGAAALRSGVQAAADGTHQLAQGESTAAAGAVRLRNGASAAHTGSQRLLQGIAAIDAGAADLDEGSRKLTASLTAGLHQMPGSLAAPMAIAQQQLRAAYDALTRMTVGRGDASYAAALASVANAAAVTSGTNPATGAHVASAMPSAVAQASTGMDSMLSDARDLSSGASTLAGDVRQIREGATTLSSGLDQLEHGQAQLSSGLGDAARRVGAAQTQFGQLVAGAGRLADGTSQLTNGIGQLGAIGQLADGGGQLATRLYQGYVQAAPLAPGLRRSTSIFNGFPNLSGQRAAGHMVLAGVQSASPAQRSQLEYVLDVDGAGQGARLFVFPSVFPTTDASAHLHDRLDRETAAFARANGLDAAVGGPGARFPEFQRVVSAFIPELIAVLSLMTFLLLVVILRALLIPAVAIALNLAITAATFGLMRVFFQGAHPLLGGPGSIDVTSAAGIFTILFALSLDYQVFLLTRMREGFQRTGEPDAAIEHGITHTARVVTGAALIMATVFLSFGASKFAIPSQLGVGLAIAVLLDALLLRLFMLPAAMHLLGRRGWWIPAWLDRLLPHFDPEGEAGDATAPRGATAEAS